MLFMEKCLILWGDNGGLYSSPTQSAAAAAPPTHSRVAQLCWMAREGKVATEGWGFRQFIPLVCKNGPTGSGQRSGRRGARYDCERHGPVGQPLMARPVAFLFQLIILDDL